MTPEIREKVRAVGELLKYPARRTTGTYARNESGYATAPTDPEACEWCLDGAVAKVTSAPGRCLPHGALYSEVHRAVGQVIGKMDWNGVEDWDNPGPERRQEIVDLLLAVEP